jgi:hypothetical protein
MVTISAETAFKTLLYTRPMRRCEAASETLTPVTDVLTLSILNSSDAFYLFIYFFFLLLILKSLS